MKDATPDRILEIGYGFQRAKVLLVAIELDVFTALAKTPQGLEALIAETGIHVRGARDFFDALVALGLLQRDREGRYANRPDADRYLDRRKPTYVGNQLRHINERHYKNWSLLEQALRTGAPQSGALARGYSVLYADKTTQDVFLSGMTAGSLLAARALAAKFDWKRYRTIIDIGAAQGCLPVEIARAHPHLSGGGFDLPEVEDAFTFYVERHGLADRLCFFAGDFFSDPLPTADVLVMGRILHNWHLDTKKMLLAKAFQALTPGGALIVYDPMIDDGRRRNVQALLSSLNMLIETVGGFEYTAADCKGWMQQAGFLDIKAEPLGDVHTAVIGFKPAR
jgi:SAM-dependent methyltransferase